MLKKGPVLVTNPSSLCLTMMCLTYVTSQDGVIKLPRKDFVRNQYVQLFDISQRAKVTHLPGLTFTMINQDNQLHYKLRIKKFRMFEVAVAYTKLFLKIDEVCIKRGVVSL